MLGTVEYMAAQDAMTAHRLFTNLVSDELSTSVDNGAYRNKLTESGQKWMLRPDQTIIALMKGVVLKLSNPKNLALDGTACKVSIVNAFQVLDKTWTFTGCKK